MKRYTLVLVAAVVAVLAAAPKNTRADNLFSDFGPHSSLRTTSRSALTPVRRIGFCLRPKTLQPSGSEGSQVSGTPYVAPTEPTISGTLNTGKPNDQNPPITVAVSNPGGSTWSPQPNNQNQPNIVTVSNPGSQSQPNTVTVGDNGGSTWTPQPSTTPVVDNQQSTPITATPEWGSTLLFLGVDLVGFVTLASLTGILRRQHAVAVQT
jgi:hypothetical protein